MHVLLVEDDEHLGDGIKSGLKQYGYSVTWLQNGKDAMNILRVESFDLVVLDLGLPEADGFTVLKFARGRGITTPVLILTANDSVKDSVSALDAGADGYMTKPFDLGEVCANIRALLRRSHGRAEGTLRHGDVCIDPASHTVTLKGEPVTISRREFVLLQKLIDNVGKVMTRDQLSQSMYGWEDDVDSNALEVHICNIRKKLGAKLIRTVRGVGYMVEKAKNPHPDTHLDDAA